MTRIYFLLIGVMAFALGWGASHFTDNQKRLDAIDSKLTIVAEAIGVEIEDAKRVEIRLDGAPSLGEVDAPVTIVEFSDFECPYCLKVNPSVARILREYPDTVRLVFKHFPLSFHENAMNAHRAAFAAGEQGKFWEMHDLIFGSVDSLEIENMMNHAATLGLDQKTFETDFHSKRTEEMIKNDMDEGRKVGVRGTPAFFINGRYLAGAQPYEVFEQYINRALDDDSA